MKNEHGHLDILYVITKSNWGGAQKYVHDLALAAEKKFSVAVALGGHGVLAEKLEAASVPVHEVVSFQRDISYLKEIKVLIELFKLFRRLRPTSVHLNSSKAGGTGALAAQLARVPNVIYTSHGLPFEEDRPFWQKGLIVFLTWVTFLLSDTVIVITGANLERARKMPWLGRRLQLIRNGLVTVPSLSQQKARAKIVEYCHIPKHGPNTVWIGTISEYHPNKGLEYLIRAIELLRKKNLDVVCILIGGGEQERYLKDVVNECGLSDTVFLPGFLDNAAQYLSAFDIFTLTSFKEGLPIAVLEAGDARLGFVGSAISSIQEIVTDMTSGILVRPKQPKEIAGALSLLIEDPERRKLYGAALKKRVDEDFSAKIMIEKTLGLYEAESTRSVDSEDVRG